MSGKRRTIYLSDELARRLAAYQNELPLGIALSLSGLIGHLLTQWLDAQGHSVNPERVTNLERR